MKPAEITCVQRASPTRPDRRRVRCRSKGRRMGDTGRTTALAVLHLLCLPLVYGVDERAMLIKLYETAGGRSWKRSAGWGVDSNVCGWFGIECEEVDGKEVVTKISLPRNNLNGIVPPDLWHLPHLKIVDLQKNILKSASFEGLKPSTQLISPGTPSIKDEESKEMPPERSPVEIIDLSKNHLTDIIGISFAKDTLRDLNVNRNQIDDIFLMELFDCTNLEALQVSYNQISSSLPTQIGRLSNLYTFHAHENRISGPLPSELGMLNKIEILGLGDNVFSGTIPPEINRMQNLRQLSLHRNPQLTGELLTFGSMPFLEILTLEGNSLTGTIPSDFLRLNTNTEKTVTVDLARNNITGTLPKSLERFEALNIDLLGNPITEIPEKLCSKGGWMDGLVEQFGCDAILCGRGTYYRGGRAESPGDCKPCSDGSAFLGATKCESASMEEWEVMWTLYTELAGNKWTIRDGWEIFEDEASNISTAIICEKFYGVQCTDGEILSIAMPENELFGTIPNAVFSLPFLEELDLSNNNVQMDNFYGAARAKSMTSLVLSNVKIKSIEGLGEVTNLEYLYLDGMPTSAALQDDFFNLTNLRVLDMQHSGFQGPLPTLLGRLSNLEELNLYGNFLTGTIPSAVGLLTSLQILELSENRFHGHLPAEIMLLSDLKTLSIKQANGTLDGKLPSFAMLTHLRELNLASNRFQGSIPDSFLKGIQNKSSVISVNLGFNQLTGVIPESLALFDRLELNLEGNQISGISDPLCDRINWMNGEMSKINQGARCNGILCPPGTWNRFGKETEDAQCDPCPKATFFGQTSCGKSERNGEQEILDSLFAKTGGEYWTKPHDNWLNPNVPICRREGIFCLGDLNDNEGVRVIHMNDFGLRGTIPSEIWELKSLQEISFSNNQVELSFDGIAQAKKLLGLKLSRCNLRNLDGLENAQSVRELHIAQNQFGGTIPEQIFGLVNLEKVYLNNNHFEGSIPATIGELSALQILDLWNNQMSSVLPSEIGLLSNLVELKLSANALSGNIPSEVLELPNLASLDISRQRGGNFGGPLPSFDQSPSITFLDLSENAFTGILPQDFLLLLNETQKIEVNLSRNQITGPIPEEWERLNNLNIDLTGNMITAIPDNICHHGGWNGGKVDLYGTCDAILCPPGTASDKGRQSEAIKSCLKCDGGIESAPYFGSLKCLNPALVVEHSILSDFFAATNGMGWLEQHGWGENIPTCSWFGIECDEDGYVVEIGLENNNVKSDSVFAIAKLLSLSRLKSLDLKGNPIDVDFAQLPRNSKLEVLQVSGTNIHTLDGISAASHLRILHATNNLIQEIPDELYDMAYLQSVFLSFNSITGTISPMFSKLSNLEQLYLFGNHLTGTIPKAIASMQALTDFFIGKNLLSGTIPAKISAMEALEQFSVVDQEGLDLITGPLPSFSRAKNLWFIDASKNDLTGEIPSDFLRDSVYKNASISVQLQGNKLSGGLPQSLGAFEFLEINLAGNQIESIPGEFCDKDGWMQGNNGLIDNCNAILCPPGTFNQFGFETPTTKCIPCNHLEVKKYLGQTHCDDFASERETLVRLFQATGGEFWENNENWNTDAPVCSWWGLRCEDGDLQDEEGVTSIILDQNGLSGTLPSIWSLPRLREFQVSGNPDLYIDLKSMHSVDSLEVLQLSQVKLVSLGNLATATNLKDLYISENDMKGTFPSELFQLSNTLESLYMSQNFFFGTLPTMIGKLSKLKRLDLFSNDFLSTIPSELGSLSELEILELSENILHGTIPSELSNMPSLKSFAAFRVEKPGPRLSGPLPAFDNVPQMSLLSFQGNELYGTIPANFLSSSKAVKSISLGLNILTGTVPEGLGTVGSLKLGLEGNQIVDYPTTLCITNPQGCSGFLCPPGTANEHGKALSSSNPCLNCTKNDQNTFFGAIGCAPSQREILMDFYHSLAGKDWHRNDLWGSPASVCDWYGVGCHQGQVISINLRANNLYGIPKPSLFYLRHLKTLWLYSNPISFSFENIGSAKRLEDLRLDATRLHSLKGIGEAKSLVSFDGAFTKLRGTVPEEILKLKNLRHLSLDNNGLSGSLPQTLGSMKFLKSLSLRSNFLTGQLPAFDDLPFLDYVDLSENLLTGSISKDIFRKLADDSKLSLFLTNNQITGIVPEEMGHFQQISIHLSGNKILGLPLSLCYNDMWNGGDVGNYWCDGIMCKPGTYNSMGRKSASGSKCKPCSTAIYYGANECPQGNFSGTRRSFGYMTILLLPLATFVLIIN